MTGFKGVWQALGQHGPLAVALVALLALGFVVFRPQGSAEPAAFSTFRPPVNRVALMAAAGAARPAPLQTPEGVARAYVHALADGNPEAVLHLSGPGSRSLDLTPSYGVPGFGLVWVDIWEVNRTPDRVEFGVRGMLADGDRQDPLARRPFEGRVTVRWADGSWYVERAELTSGRS